MYYNQRLKQDELMHYGVLGMRWGQRKEYEPHPRKKNSKEKNGLTDKQKKYIKIGTAAVGTALVAYGGYKLYKSGKLDDFKSKGERIIKGIIEDSNKTTHKKSELKSIKEIIKGVNPTKSNTNCRACALAAALNMSGHDVEAKDIPGGTISEVINKCFMDAKTTSMASPSKERLSNYIDGKFKDGDVGIVTSSFKQRGLSGGHAFNVTKENGIVKFFDAQKELDDFSEYLNLIDPSMEATITKVNGLKLNWKGIYEYVKKR